MDDDDDIREIIGEAQETAGYRVARASNGAEALRLLRSNSLRPDLILLDIMMLVFTAYGDHRRIAQELQAAGSLSKPLRLDELLSTIARVPREPVGRP